MSEYFWSYKILAEKSSAWILSPFLYVYKTGILGTRELPSLSPLTSPLMLKLQLNATGPWLVGSEPRGLGLLLRHVSQLWICRRLLLWRYSHADVSGGRKGMVRVVQIWGLLVSGYHVGMFQGPLWMPQTISLLLGRAAKNRKRKYWWHYRTEKKSPGSQWLCLGRSFRIRTSEARPEK